jgi:hypothetical protein
MVDREEHGRRSRPPVARNPLLTLTPRGVTLLLPLDFGELSRGVSTGGLRGPSTQLNFSPRKGATHFSGIPTPPCGGFVLLRGAGDHGLTPVARGLSPLRGSRGLSVLARGGKPRVHTRG